MSAELSIHHDQPVPAPLIVDLDNALIFTNVVAETFVVALVRAPLAALKSLGSLFRGGLRAFEERLADVGNVDAALLPYNQAVVEATRRAAAEGRPVYLLSARSERYGRAVASHLNLLAGWIACNDGGARPGESRIDRLVRQFGQEGFDYIGEDGGRPAIWRNTPHSPDGQARSGETVQALEPADNETANAGRRPRAGLKTWLRLIRVHQYAKNGLVLVPVLTGHAFALDQLTAAFMALVSFCLVASSVYIVNDIVDLEADRAHPTKRRRPIASGEIPIVHGLLAVPVLLGVGMGLAVAVSLPFLLVLLGYLAVTTAYSFYLKRRLLIDVVALAGLYTLRVIAGSVATQVGMSEWLLGFSMFLFMSLALVKRYTELGTRESAGLPDPKNRNYRIADMPMLGSLAAASGFSAVVVFGLYLSSDAVRDSYSRPYVLWLACPILMYWIGRVLIMAQRRDIHDDPIVFALKDRISVLALIVLSSLVLAAI